MMYLIGLLFSSLVFTSFFHMYYSSFNPNINLTKPLKNFGTFFTTIFIFNHTPPYNVQIWFGKIKFWQNLKGNGTYFVYVVVNVTKPKL